jgi:hypothetical protein
MKRDLLSSCKESAVRKASVLPGASRRPLPLRAALAAAATAVTCAAFGALGAAPASAAVVTVTLSGSATGTVTSVPAGIKCSNVLGAEATDCSFDFPFSWTNGAKLTAVGADGAAFKDWTGTAGGTCSGGVNPCETGFPQFAEVDATATFAPTPDRPVVVTGAASGLVFPSAVLSGTVNPNSAEFDVEDCYFEYGTSTDYGSRNECGPSPGSGTDVVSVQGSAGLLAASTTYHYRLVAVNAGGKSVGEDRTFTSAAAPADPCPNAAIRAQQGAVAQRLPECYAYELVSPASTAGQIPGFRASDPAGSSDVLIRSVGGFADVGNLASFGTTYRATRAAAGWKTEALGEPPAADFPNYNSEIDWTADWWRDAKPRTMWQVRPAGSLIKESQPVVGVKGGPWVPLALSDTWEVQATDTSLNRVLLASAINKTSPRPQLSDGTVDTREQSKDSLTVASRRPDGSLDLRQVARQGGATMFPECPMTVGTSNGVTRGAVDREGLTRIVFTAGFCGQDEARRVFVSEPFSSAPDAFDASASQCVNPCGPPQPVKFVGGSLDTERIYMTTTQRLVDADENETSDLYEYNFRRPAADRLQLLTGNASPAEVLGVARTSDSGSHVYFAARGALADAVITDGGPGPVAGSPNLYVRISGPAGEDPVLRFVGTLDEQDTYLWEFGGNNASTSDGRFLAFSTAARVTSDKVAGDSDADVYRFDAASGELRRLWVSDPAHNGSARVDGSAFGGSPQNGPYANYQSGRESYSISPGGDRILFSTKEPLVAGDANNGPDYFVWNATDESITMISDGRDPRGALSANLSPDGKTVFLATASRIVPQHTATSVALYALRQGGGFPAPAEPAGPCEADACQGQLSAPPGLPPAAGSVTFQGTGNAPSGPSVPASVSVSKLKAVTGTSATLKVKVPAAGRITVAGSMIRRVTRSTTRSATYSLRISLTTAAKRSLGKKKSLRATVKVTFAPKAGASASKSTKVTFKQPRVKKKSRSAKTSVWQRSFSAKGGN